MELDKFEEIFERMSSDLTQRKFDDIKNKLNSRRDLHALILLNSILPPSAYCMISAAEHDIIYFDVELDELAKVITEDQIRELVICGLFIQDDSLAKFV